MYIKLLRFGTVGISVLSLLFFIKQPLVASAQTSYICGYSTSGVLQSGMTGYYYPYIIECSTGEKIGWGNLGGWGLEKHVRINEPVIVEITPIQLNDGTVISKEIRTWLDYLEISDCNACEPSEPPVSPISQTSQIEQLCGWVDFVPEPPGGQVMYDFVMHVWGTDETVHLRQPLYVEYDNAAEQNWAAQFFTTLIEPGYYRLYNSVQENDWIVLFDKIERVETCEVSTPTLVPTPIPVPTPTPLPTPVSPVLEVTYFQVEPTQVSVFELVRITMVIENRGAPFDQPRPFWGYRGEVLLENESGEVIDRHSFAKGDSSDITPVAEGRQVNLNKWQVTVKVRFDTSISKSISNGRVIVRIQPDADMQQPELIGEGRLTINPSLSGLTCTSVIVNKLVGPFLPDIRKDLLDAITAELQAVGCSDGDVACAAPPLVKGLVKILGRDIFGSIGKIIIGIWGVFDTDALQVCRDSVNWMWQLLREFNRQGVPISVSGVHSPMTILVTNSVGQRAGFVSEDEIVTELPDSRVIEWEGDKYVIYPANNNITISLKGTGNGIASLSLIDGQSGREVSYSSIPVSDGTNAHLDLSDQQFQLVVDTNGDGNADEVHNPELVEVLRQIETPTASPLPANEPTGICGGTLGLTMFPFLVLVVRRFRKSPR